MEWRAFSQYTKSDISKVWSCLKSTSKKNAPSTKMRTILGGKTYWHQQRGFPSGLITQHEPGGYGWILLIMWFIQQIMTCQPQNFQDSATSIACYMGYILSFLPQCLLAFWLPEIPWPFAFSNSLNLLSDHLTHIHNTASLETPRRGGEHHWLPIIFISGWEGRALYADLFKGLCLFQEL